jgi:hypothetical protein
MIRNRRNITSAVALTLALVTSVAPAAFGDPPAARACGACDGNGSFAGPNPDTLAAPVPAQLRETPIPVHQPNHGRGPNLHGSMFEQKPGSYAGPNPDTLSTEQTAAGARVTPQPAIRVVRIPQAGGFDWGDAGIGAAGAVLVIGLGGAGVATRRRGGHLRRQRAAVTS